LRCEQKVRFADKADAQRNPAISCVDACSPKTRKYLEDKVEQLKLREMVTPLARDIAKYGSVFVEMIVTDQGDGLAAINPLPVLRWYATRT